VAIEATGIEILKKSWIQTSDALLKIFEIVVHNEIRTNGRYGTVDRREGGLENGHKGEERGEPANLQSLLHFSHEQ
jgi:hypothetical protein